MHIVTYAGGLTALAAAASASIPSESGRIPWAWNATASAPSATSHPITESARATLAIETRSPGGGNSTTSEPLVSLQYSGGNATALAPSATSHPITEPARVTLAIETGTPGGWNSTTSEPLVSLQYPGPWTRTSRRRYPYRTRHRHRELTRPLRTVTLSGPFPEFYVMATTPATTGPTPTGSGSGYRSRPNPGTQSVTLMPTAAPTVAPARHGTKGLPFRLETALRFCSRYKAKLVADGLTEQEADDERANCEFEEHARWKASATEAELAEFDEWVRRVAEDERDDWEESLGTPGESEGCWNAAWEQWNVWLENAGLDKIKECKAKESAKK